MVKVNGNFECGWPARPVDDRQRLPLESVAKYLLSASYSHHNPGKHPVLRSFFIK
jgi:hypothetical protein